MIKKEDLIAGETVLVNNFGAEIMTYQGCVGGCLFFTSEIKAFALTLKQVNNYNYIIKQPISNVVPLEKRTYDFVPVRVSDDRINWFDAELIAVDNETYLPYIAKRYTTKKCVSIAIYKYCEFVDNN